MSVVGARTGGDGFAALNRRSALLRQCWPFVLVFAAALLVRHFVVANTDVSWDITLCEKILDGQRLYVDLIEINPPATIFLYMPAVALARILGLPPQIAVSTFIFLIAFASLGFTGHIVSRYRLPDGRGRTVAALVLAILLILPAHIFGEREHIALIAVLPILATLAARANGARPLLRHCIVAGLCAAVTVCIKPHFALAIGFAALTVAWHLRSWRALFVLENWLGAAVAVLYGLSVIVFYPPFITDVMPLVAHVYLPVRLSLLGILMRPATMLWAGALLAVYGLWREAGSKPQLAILLAASAGFAAAYALQGKGWPYQSYPMLALALIAAGLAALSASRGTKPASARGQQKIFGASLALGVITAVCFAWFNLSFDPGAIAAVIKRNAPPNPAITVISDDVSVGFPLLQEVHGRWISRVCGLWITQDAAVLDAIGGLDQAAKRRLSDYVQAQRRELIGEIRDGKPDIILIDDRPDHALIGNHLATWGEWLKADRDLSALVASRYRQIGNADEVVILKRNGT